MQHQSENKVTIRIWLNVSDKFGHVSLQAREANLPEGEKGIYASIYPSGRGIALANRKGRPFKTKTLEEDLRKKYSYPPITISLYILNVEAIEQAFQDFQKKGYNFSFLGSSIFKDEKTQNCAGLTLYLLEAGGISHLVPTYMQMLSKFSKLGIAGETINFYFGRTTLSIFRIGLVALALAAFYWMLCEHNSPDKDKFINSIQVLKSTLICGGAGGIISAISSKVDEDAKHYHPFSAALIGGITGAIAGGSSTALAKHIATQYDLVPNIQKYGKYLTPVLGLGTFYVSLAIFGERSFLTRNVAKAIGISIDTQEGNGIIITPSGIEKLVQKVKKIEESFQKKRQISTTNSNRFFSNSPILNAQKLFVPLSLVLTGCYILAKYSFLTPEIQNTNSLNILP